MSNRPEIVLPKNVSTEAILDALLIVEDFCEINNLNETQVVITALINMVDDTL